MIFAPDLKNIAAIIVTRGDVDLTPVCEPFADAGISEIMVWDNGRERLKIKNERQSGASGLNASNHMLVRGEMIRDLSVYGRYAAIEHVTAPVILVVDDDVALDREAVLSLVAAYEPGKIVANMPTEYRTRYTDSCLVGFGAIFDRDLPSQAFAKLGFDGRVSPFIEDDWERFQRTQNGVTFHIGNAGILRRTCDVVFTTLTPFTLVDLPFTYLPQTRAPNRMYRQPGNTLERQRMLELCRKVRDHA
jgi:hypothetical protein